MAPRKVTGISPPSTARHELALHSKPVDEDEILELPVLGQNLDLQFQLEHGGRPDAMDLIKTFKFTM